MKVGGEFRQPVKLFLGQLSPLGRRFPQSLARREGERAANMVPFDFD